MDIIHLSKIQKEKRETISFRTIQPFILIVEKDTSS